MVHRRYPNAGSTTEEVVTIRITVSTVDPLVRDLVGVRSSRLGLVCEQLGAVLAIHSGDQLGDERAASLVIVGAIDAEALELCGREGVIGVLTHESPSALLDLALARSDVDGLIVDPRLAARLARRVTRAEPLGANQGLTEREGEVLQQMALGLPMKQIAAVLGITTKTVENHTTKLYAKLGVRNRREAVARISGHAPDVAT